jgi:acylphosphatase
MHPPRRPPLHPAATAATIIIRIDTGESMKSNQNEPTGTGGAPSDRTARHVVFRGHVQGVGFRYTARQIAQQYQVGGFVRNLPDGTVEMLIQGPTQDISNCLQEIRDFFEGHIRDTEIEEAPCNPRYTDFRVAV